MRNGFWGVNGKNETIPAPWLAASLYKSRSGLKTALALIKQVRFMIVAFWINSVNVNPRIVGKIFVFTKWSWRLNGWRGGDIPLFISLIWSSTSKICKNIHMSFYGGTKRDKRPVESRDSETISGLSGILVPKCRDLLSRAILVAGLPRRFFSRSRLSRGFESRSRSQSRGFAGPGPGSRRHSGPAYLTCKPSICWEGTLLGTHAHRGATVPLN